MIRGGFDEWGLSYFEHLMQHPELVLVWDATERSFHTGCTRHALARACWARGEVPGDFVCPFERGGDCLMRPLLGRRVRWRRVAGSGRAERLEGSCGELAAGNET
jgi:hypothetical protein